jgi:hypothetical protein
MYALFFPLSGLWAIAADLSAKTPDNKALRKTNGFALIFLRGAFILT